MGSRHLASVVTLSCSLMLSGALTAHAEPAPTPAPSARASQGTPRAEQVRAARAALAAAAVREKALEEDLATAEAELQRIAAVAELATERYNEARVQLAQRTAAAAAAKTASTAANRRAGDARLRVYQLAATLYMQGGSLGGLESILGLDGTGDVARQAADMDAVSGFRKRTFDDARERAAQAEEARRAAAQAQLQQQAAATRAQTAFTSATNAAAKAAVEQKTIQDRRDAAMAELARLRRTSVAVEQARTDGLAAQAEQARQARLAASQRASRASAGVSVDLSALPKARSKQAERAIAYARDQLGKPYVWAAEGPDSFDCSGLTMRAWEQGGRSLVHYSGAQYASTARVPIEALEPGDLVFFGADVPSIHHVGLYIGDGTMIEAPYTGSFVRISSIYRKDLLPYGGRP